MYTYIYKNIHSYTRKLNCNIYKGNYLNQNAKSNHKLLYFQR